MMRALLLSAVLLAPLALAQDAAPHDVPFPTGEAQTHAVELALGGADGEVLSVAVAASPDWLVFPAPSATARGAQDAEPTARLAFTVAPSAPVGEPAEVELVVTDASGAERARHTVRLRVAAPELSLRAPWPNPARGAARLAFTVPTAGPVRLSVVDVLGREVAVLADGARDAGRHEVAVPAGRLAAGTYAIVLRAGGAQRVERWTVVR